MKFACLLAAIFCLNFTTTTADYTVCATLDHLEACKRLEATKKSIKCLRVADSTECFQQILKKKADFGTFTPEEAILALLHIKDEIYVVAELRQGDRINDSFAFETVAVVSRNFTGGLSNLKNSTYCHPGFSQGRYWSDRVLKYFESTVIAHFNNKIASDIPPLSADEEELYNLSKVFRKACRPGAWSINDWWDKKLKRDYGALCAKCDFPSTCSYKSETYNEHFSALKCLTEEEGAVAYTALDYVNQFFNLKSDKSRSQADPNDYKFLCKDGSTRPLGLSACTWMRQPWAVVLSLSSTASNVSQFLKNAMVPDLSFSGWKTALKKIVVNGDGQLIFMDGPMKLKDYIERGRSIPQYEQNGRSLHWCTVSAKEKSKCEFMSSAALIFGIPVQIKCNLAPSKIGCLKKIQKSESDVTFIDTELGFLARKVYNMTSAAFVETEKSGNYYGVVVTKGNTIKKFKDLKGTSACFPFYNGLGWLSHVQNVRRRNLVPDMLCSDSHGLWNFFSKACAPGAKSAEMNNFYDMIPDKICQSCTTKEHCNASSVNPYFSDIGALKCLNNGDGHIALVNFYSIKKFFESGTNDVEDLKLENFKILCRDESIKDFTLDDPEECSITQLNGGELVMKDSLPLHEKRDIILTLIKIDDIFGHTMKQYPPTFRIYEPFEGESGLLFEKTSVALISVFDTQNEYVNNYLKLQNEMSVCYRDNKCAKIYVALPLIIVATIIIVLQ